MKKQKRLNNIMFWATDEERKLIEQKMEQLGTTNMSAYLRKMAIDGYIIKLELPELKELVSLLRYSSNNINQIARHVNATNQIYGTEMEQILQNQQRLWDCANEIITKLSML